jgi:hypothetical protein
VNILLMMAHSIEEYDQVKLLSELGYNVFSIGAYIDPAHPQDDKRPALPEVAFHPELKAAVDELGKPDNLDAAKRHVPDKILDWADTIIVHHLEHTWLIPQWDRLREHRVIWRTVGQSVDGNERMMTPLHQQGMQIVRYSPKERNIPNYAGEDALIRFYKDPDEWCGWTGDDGRVINITQNLRQRDPYTNWRFWEASTRDLPRMAIGPGSEVIGGVGAVSVPDMKAWLRQARCYLYTGTQPASYTLGLIEAMMTGIPVVSIGPSWMRIFPYGHDMFEGHEIAGTYADEPTAARSHLLALLNEDEYAVRDSQRVRERAIDLFGKAKIGAEWKAFLG